MVVEDWEGWLKQGIGQVSGRGKSQVELISLVLILF
jgi:hypothetical protein